MSYSYSIPKFQTLIDEAIKQKAGTAVLYLEWNHVSQRVEYHTRQSFHHNLHHYRKLMKVEDYEELRGDYSGHPLTAHNFYEEASGIDPVALTCGILSDGIHLIAIGGGN
jgi:hypothetical protein